MLRVVESAIERERDGTKNKDPFFARCKPQQFLCTMRRVPFCRLNKIDGDWLWLCQLLQLTGLKGSWLLSCFWLIYPILCMPLLFTIFKTYYISLLSLLFLWNHHTRRELVKGFNFQERLCKCSTPTTARHIFSAFYSTWAASFYPHHEGAAVWW